MALPAHQQVVADKILDFKESMNKHDFRTSASSVLSGLHTLGPACFWEEIDNDQEAQGAIKLLGWIQAYLEQ